MNYDGEQTITPKEWAITIVVVMVMASISVLIYPSVRDHMMAGLLKYQRAVKTTDATEFSYAQKTQVGDVLGYGELTPTSAVTFPELTQKYAAVSRIHEHWTMHEYTTENCTGTGESEVCTSEIHYYWSWDWDGEEDAITPAFLFLGAKFPSNRIDISPFETVSLNSHTLSPQYQSPSGTYIYVTGDDRYYFVDIPLSVKGTMFVNFGQTTTNPENTGGQLEFSRGQTIDDVVAYRKNMMQTDEILYFALVITFGVAIYLILAYEVLDIE